MDTTCHHDNNTTTFGQKPMKQYILQIDERLELQGMGYGADTVLPAQ